MKRVAVIDYGMGNLDSVARAIEECGGRPSVTDRAEDNSPWTMFDGVKFDPTGDLEAYAKGFAVNNVKG